MSDEPMKQRVDWLEEAGLLSIVAHESPAVFAVLFKMFLMHVYLPDDHGNDVFKAIAEHYPDVSQELRKESPHEVFMYDIFMSAPSPEAFFDRFNCEHFKIGMKYGEEIN